MLLRSATLLTTLIVAGVSAKMLAGSFGPPAQADVTIRIDVSKPAEFRIPRSIFGTFLEPIGNSIYNGLWAQILQNPSFEDGLWSAKNVATMLAEDPPLARSSELSLPIPWEPLDYAQGARYAPQWGDAANSQRSLLLMALPQKQTGVRQEVYLPVHRTLHYMGSVYLKHLSGAREVEISFRERNQSDNVLAAQKIQMVGNDWREYKFALDLKRTQLRSLQEADFVISAGN